MSVLEVKMFQITCSDVSGTIFGSGAENVPKRDDVQVVHFDVVHLKLIRKLMCMPWICTNAHY